MLIRIKRRIEKQALLRVLALALVTFSFTPSFTQLPYLDRLPKAIFDVEAPSSRVTGTPGSMVYLERDCRSLSVENLRNRVVNTAIQEWAYFGYSIYWCSIMVYLDRANFGRKNGGFQRKYCIGSEQE